MASRKRERLAEIREFASGRAVIGEPEFAALRQGLAPIGEPALRKLLRESGVPLSPVAEGVRQEDLESLERTLTALAAEYGARPDRAERRKLRRLVITAKDHARFAARAAKDESKRRMKEEMAAWLLVWLENPDVFTTWVALRKRAIEEGLVD